MRHSRLRIYKASNFDACCFCCVGCTLPLCCSWLQLMYKTTSPLAKKQQASVFPMMPRGDGAAAFRRLPSETSRRSSSFSFDFPQNKTFMYCTTRLKSCKAFRLKFEEDSLISSDVRSVSPIFYLMGRLDPECSRG